MYISRTIRAAIERFIGKFPIVSLTGPRQGGKTTLLRTLFPDYRYVTLENTDLREYALRDPNGFLRTYDRRVIFDEVQRAPQLFSYLQTKVDESQMMGQFILSGSQNFLLMEKITQSLAGRVAVMKLLPLSIAELRADQQSFSASLPDMILKGGYPALYHRELTPMELFPSYIETYVERDVRDILKVQDLIQFQSFMRLCAGRVGQLLNMQSLAADAGINVATARSWLSVLESSYIVHQLPPYFRNFNKRITKSTKLYFYDTGLACYLLNLRTPEQVETYYQRGSLFENLMLSEMIKKQYNQGLPAQFYFWRDSNGVEIDLVSENGTRLDFYEMKYSYTPNSEFFKNIAAVRKIEAFPDGDNFVVYAGEENQHRTAAEVLSWTVI